MNRIEASPLELRIENLGMRFLDAGREVTVFEGLNFSVAAGTTAALIGQSGSGKTTLLNILGGLEIPSSGAVIMGGRDIAAAARAGEDLAEFRGAHVGYVFQQYHLFAEFDALENVAMPLILQGKSMDEARVRAQRLLERVGLGARASHRPGELSGGEQQRVAIARALAPRPSVILADEPTGNLDARTGQMIRELLLEIQQEANLTLVVATHSMELAGDLQKVFELSAGKISER